MTKVEKIEEILSNNWAAVYETCESVQECSDYILSKLDEDEEMLIHEEWGMFSDMVDDAYHYGFTTLDGVSFELIQK